MSENPYTCPGCALCDPAIFAAEEAAMDAMFDEDVAEDMLREGLPEFNGAFR
jgi:hypothetical protein